MGIIESLGNLNQNLERFRVPEGEASGRFFSSVEATGEDVTNTIVPDGPGLPTNPDGWGNDGDGSGSGGWGIPWLKIFAGIAALVALNAFAGGAGEGITQ